MRTETGCHVLLFGALLCVAVTQEPASGECKSYERKCSDGTCVRFTSNCPGKCDSEFHMKCDNGDCINKYRQSCPGQCRFDEKRCEDGSCVFKFGTFTCPEDCPFGYKKCSDGKCVDKVTKRCSNGPCPFFRPYRCSEADELLCYSKDEKCDGIRDCSSGKDEESCDGSFNIDHLWFFLLVPMIGFFIFLTRCLYKYQEKYGENSSTSSATGRMNYSGLNTQPIVSRTGPPVGPVTLHRDETHTSQGREQGAQVQGGAGTLAAPAPDDPPPYDDVVSSEPYTLPAEKQGLPSYEEVSDIPPWNSGK